MTMADREALVELLSQHPPEVAGSWYGCAGCKFSLGNAASYAGHLADVMAAEFLVVPRSDITGTEYGWRFADDDGARRSSERMWALADAELNGGQAVERPSPPWTPIRPEVPDGPQ